MRFSIDKLALVLGCSAIAFAQPALAPMVKTVPWTDGRAHTAIVNRSVTLKGTSSIAGPNIRATWDFGDGSAALSFTIEHAYDAAAAHRYSSVGEFTATLTITDTASGPSSSATYQLTVKEASLDAEVDQAIDEGLWSLHKSIESNAANAWALLAFERAGRLESGAASDPYTATVSLALDALTARQNSGDTVTEEALAISGSARTRAAMAGISRSTFGLTGTNDLPSQLLALRSRGVVRPDARWVQLESRLRDQASFDFPTSSLFELAQALRPVQFIQSDHNAPLDWFSAEFAHGDATDGVARTIVNRQSSYGSFGDAATTAKAVLALLQQSPGSITNVTSQVTVTHTAWVYNRGTGKYSGTLTITNAGAQSITGPFAAGLLNVASGVTPLSPAGIFNGALYYLNNPAAASLAPGASVSIPLQFTVTPATAITFSQVIYAGTVPPEAFAVTCPAATGTEGSPYSSSLVASGGVLPYTFSITPGSLPHNLLLDSGSGAITGTPDTVAPSTFTANVTDSAGGTAETNSASCSITIASANTAPVANAQSPSTNEDVALPITLHGTDADGDALTFAISSGPANGTLGLLGGPSCSGHPSTCMASITYSPSANFNGSDSFTFKVNDGTVDSSPATVSITIVAVNDVPSFTKGADQVTQKSATPVTQTVANWATAISAGPANESTQTVNFILSTNNNPLFATQPAIDASGTLTYKAAANATGVATVTVQIHDNGSTANGGVDTSASQTFTITVSDPPQISSATSGTFAPGKLGQSFTVTTTGFPGGASMTLSESGTLPTGVNFTDNGNGTATLNGTPASGTQGNTGTPNSKAYPVTLGASNGVSPTASQSFTLNITCPAITVSGSIPALSYNVAITPVTFTQLNGNGTMVWSMNGVNLAGLTMNPSNGQVSGTPNATGTFTVNVVATDAGGCAGTKQVTFAVNPVAMSDSYSTLVDNTEALVTGGLTSSPATPFVTLTGSILSNDTPNGGVTAVAQTVTTSGGGSAVIAADGTFKYTPAAHPTATPNTTDSFTYTISSNTGSTPTATTASGTVNLSLAGRVWYVQTGGSDSNSGQSQAPFLTLAKAATVSTSNDTIFVYSGNDANLGAAALKQGQSLIGQGAALTLNAHTLVAAGTFPTIGGTLSASSVTGLTVNGVKMSTGAASAVSLSSVSGAFTFRSISTNGAPHGITLSTTSGSFDVEGDGASDSTNTTHGRVTTKLGGGTVALGSGGTIQSTTSSGVLISNAANVTLRNMVIQNNGGSSVNSSGEGIAMTSTSNVVLDNLLVTGQTGNSGVRGTTVSSLSFIHCEVSSNATTAGVEASDVWDVNMTNLSGTSGITGSLFYNSRENIFGIANSGTTSLTLTVSNSEFRDTATASPGNDGLSVNALNSAVTNVTISNSTFLRNSANGFQYTGNNSTSGGISISNTTFDGDGTEINIAHQGAGQTLSFQLANNLLRQTIGGSNTALNIFLGGSSSATTLMSGTISGNTVGTNAVAQSGSKFGKGIDLFASGAGTLTASLTNNVIRQTFSDSAFRAVSSTHTGRINVTLTGNDFTTEQSGQALDGMNFVAGAINTDTGEMCIHSSGNVAAVGDGSAGGSGITVFTEAGSPIIDIQGYSGAANNSSQLQTFMNSTATTVNPSSLVAIVVGTIRAAPSNCPIPQ